MDAQTGNEGALNRLSRQIAKGGGIALVGEAWGRGVNLALQILLTHVLGAGTYGLYALGHSVLEISMTFAQLGLQNGVVRFGSVFLAQRDRSRLKGVLLGAFMLSGTAGTIIAVLLLLSADLVSKRVFGKPQLGSVLRVFALSIPFLAFMSVSAHAARVVRRADYSVGLRYVVHPLAVLVFVGAGLLMGYHLRGAIIGFVLGSFFSFLAGAYSMWRLFPDLRMKSRVRPKYEVRKLVPYSLTVLAVGFSNLLMMKIDRVMLGVLGTTQNVGIYNAAASLARQVTIFLGAFSTIFAPIIASLWSQGRAVEMGQLLKTTTKWIIMLSLPVFIVFVVFARSLMGLFGREFVVGWPALVGLGAAQLVNAGTGFVGVMLTMTGHHRLALANSIALAGANVVLNLLLIPRYGIVGAATATGISLAAINLVRLGEIWVVHRIHPYKASVWRPIGVGLLTVGVGLGTKQVTRAWGIPWPVAAVFTLLFYALALALYGLDNTDRAVWRVVKRRLWNS